MKHIFIIGGFILLFCSNLFSQEVIDVKTMIISQNAGTGTTSFNLTTANSSNQQVVYSSGDSSALSTYAAFDCNPCNLSSILSTNGFGKGGFRANLGQNSGQVIVTFSNPPSSDNIVLRPTLTRRKNSLQFQGSTQLSISKIEVTNMNGQVIAIDNDVILTGAFTANFWQNGSAYSRRTFGFQNITFAFDEPRN